MFDHVPIPEALRCHWVMQFPVPLLVVAVRVTVPPIQTIEAEGVMKIEGSGVTSTVVALEIVSSQPLPVQE